MELHARILIVEDEPEIRRFVRMTLESEAHEVARLPGMLMLPLRAG